MDIKNSATFRTEILPLIKTIFVKIFDIRDGELLRALLMLLNIFLIISSLLIVKPVATALFLSEFGVAKLPVAFILVAFFAALVVTLYSKLVKILNLRNLILRTYQVSIMYLLLFWGILVFRGLAGWTLYVFYVWVAIFAVVSASQFWILANFIFNAREAKRLFGFLGAGAIAGGIFGGYLTNFLAPVVGSENLLVICVLFLSLCIPIVNTVWQKSLHNFHTSDVRELKTAFSGSENPIRILRQSRHVIYLASIVGISVLAARLVEFQFSAVAAANILEEDQLTAFFGFWLSNLNIISLLIQLLLTRRVVGMFGVGTSLLFLPISILVGAFGILIHPALWTAVFIKISDGSLKNSINKAGMELLALPIPGEIKNQTKTFVDVFVDSLATGLGGVLLILLTLISGFSVRYVSLLIIVLIAGWIYLVFKIRKEYIQSFRLKIERETEESPDEQIDIRKESIYGGLLKILEGDSEKQILAVLKMSREVQNPLLLPVFKKLLQHESDDIRLEVLRNLYYYKVGDIYDDVEKLVEDPDLEIRTAALEFLFRNANKPAEMIQKHLSFPHYKIRGAALLCVARESRNNIELQKALAVGELIESTIKQIPHLADEEEIEFTKSVCARAIGRINIPGLYPYLHIFLNAKSPKVVKAAIESAADSRLKEFIPGLIQYLGKAPLRNTARESLQRFGPEALDVLADYFENQGVDRELRLNLPLAIAEFKVQKAADILIRNLDHPDVTIRFVVIKALNKLRTTATVLKFADHPINTRILTEANNFKDMLAVLYAQGNMKFTHADKTAAKEIEKLKLKLVRNLERRLDLNLERIFRLLGLKYPPDDIYNAYLGIQKSNPMELRANAVEFLDNLLETNLKNLIVPVIETTLLDTMASETLRKFNLQVPTEEQCFQIILTGDDNELKLLVLKLIGLLKDEKYLPHIGVLISNPDENIRKMARQVLTEIGIIAKGNI